MELENYLEFSFPDLSSINVALKIYVYVKTVPFSTVITMLVYKIVKRFICNKLEKSLLYTI